MLRLLLCIFVAFLVYHSAVLYSVGEHNTLGILVKLYSATYNSVFAKDKRPAAPAEQAPGYDFHCDFVFRVAPFLLIQKNISTTTFLLYCINYTQQCVFVDLFAIAF